MVTPQPRLFPQCPKCEGKNFTSQSANFKKTPVIIIYCESCGSVLGIVNTPQKQNN